MMPLRLLQTALWAVALTAAGMFGLYSAGVIGAGAQHTATAPAVAEIGGSFRLTSHKAATVTDRDFKGKPFAVFFGFTHCPEVCPTTLFELSELLKELGPEANKITPVFITVDPERDTKEVLSEYLQAFDPRIIGLTGTEAEVDAAARAYKAYRRKVPSGENNYTMDHTAIVYLMNREGRMANSLDGHKPRETRLRKLQRLIHEN